MEFNESEIWNRPVPEHIAPAEPDLASGATAPTTGRLYASAGVTGHPDAIVALPHHTRNFVSVAELPDPVTEAPAPQAPIINDPAIAEVLQPVAGAAVETPPSFEWANSIEVTPEAEDPFKDWYAAAAESVPAVAPTGPAAQKVGDAALRARTQLHGIGARVTHGSFDIRRYSTVAFVVTMLVGVVDALIGGTIGMPFGLALIASTGFGSFKLGRTDAWVGWVMPAYIAIAAILVAGQFADGAPGFSIVGQVLLVGTMLITIAPWLAIATLVGVVAPRFRKA